KMDVKPDFGNVQVENVTCQPSSVEVRRLPSLLAKGKYAERVLHPAAEQAVRQWRSAHQNDEAFTLDLPLAIPEASATVEISPAGPVKVSGRFVNLFATVTKGPVQILFAIPPELERQYVLKPSETSNFRPDVVVRGPTADVETLTPQQIFVYVEVLASDAAGPSETVRRAPHVVLPPGLQFERELQEVEFELIERPAPSDGVRD